jgi:hypothetical protein
MKRAKLSQVLLIVLTLAASLVVPVASRADGFNPQLLLLQVGEFLLMLVALFLLTLLIEIPIVVLPLRKHLTSPRRLILLLIAINACSYAGLALFMLLVLGSAARALGELSVAATEAISIAGLVLGEVAVAIIEAMLVWGIVRPQLAARPGDQAPSRRFVMGLVVLANLASAVIGAILSTRIG